MLMHSAEVKSRIAQLKNARRERLEAQIASVQDAVDDGNIAIGNVSQFNEPLRTHVDFRLQTHEQTQAHLQQVSDALQRAQFSQKQKQELGKQQRAAWLSKVRGETTAEQVRKCRAFAPEIREMEDPNRKSRVVFDVKA